MDAFRFFYKTALNFIWIILPLIGLSIYSFKKRKKAISEFGRIETVGKLIKGVSISRIYIKYAMLITAFIFIFLSLGRPQMGTREEFLKRKGVDIFVCLDVSKSMLAEDIKPNRLFKAKHEIGKFIDLIEEHRIGLVLFAGNSAIKCPLTLDYGAAKIFLNIAGPHMVSRGGTAIGEAIRTASAGFVQSEKQYKVIIILTDGEEHESDSIAASKKAAEQGILIYTIGIGSLLGEPIPETGKTITGYKEDEAGYIVMSKLNEKILKEIAFRTGGKYYRGSAKETELRKIYNNIEKMKKKELTSKVFTHFEERFQYPLGATILLIIAELMFPERRKFDKKWKGRFE